MKKISVIIMAILLTLCGVRTMASFLSLTSMGSDDYVSIPSDIAVKAGETITLPISLDNSNLNYVGFEMSVVLPKGITPVLNDKGKLITTKTDRLDASHTLSCNFDEAANTIKIVCTSLESETFTGTTGELFSVDLQADASLWSGNYQVALNNVLFTTSSSAPEGAVGYTLSDVTATVSVTGDDIPADIDVPTALDIVSKLEVGECTNAYYLIHGVVTSVRNVYLNYGDATFYITSENAAGQELMIYQAYGLNGEKITDENYIQVGDQVVVYARLQNYKGIPETYRNGYLTSLIKPDHIAVPSSMNVKTGKVFSLPISLENDNPNYAGFQMDIRMPAGITPALNSKGKVVTTKTDRLDETHTISCNYDENENVIKVVCTSMESALITGTSGELFSIDLVANTPGSGYYQVTLSDILFTTSSSAPEGAVGYQMNNTYSTLNVEYVPSWWTIAGTWSIFGSDWNTSDTSNDMTEVEEDVYVLNKKNVFLRAGNLYEFKVVGNHSWDINYGADGMADGPNVEITVDQTGMYNLQFFFYNNENHMLAYNVELASEETDEMDMIYYDYTANHWAFPYYVMGYVLERNWNTGAMTDLGAMYRYVSLDNDEGLTSDVIVNTENGEQYYRIELSEPGWHQYFLADGLYTDAGGRYHVKALVRASEATNINVNMGWGWGEGQQASATVAIGTEWQEVEWDYYGVPSSSSCNLIAQPGTFTGTIEWKNVTVYKVQTRVNLEINVEEPGTLRDLIANEGYSLEEIVGLTVTGSLNNDDMYAIREMYNLVKIDMGEAEATEIPYETFYYRSNLRSVILPKNLQTIGSYAFCGCNLLTEITLPETLQSISYWAFGECYSLTEITLPESLQSIGYYAFGNCSNLKSITCNLFTPISLSNYFMSDWNASQCTLYVPAIAVEAYQNAYFWQYFQIQGTDYMPENIFIGSTLTINWPENLDGDYKPNVSLGQGYNSGAYGALTMNGESIISMNNFSMLWNPYDYYSRYNSETGNYEWYRYSNTSLIANTPMRADNVSVELRTRTFRWDFISFPFDVKVSDITNLTQTNAPLVIRRYDGEKRANAQMGETWVDMTPESTLEAGKGYIWQSANGEEDYSNNNFSVPALNNSNKNNLFTSNDVTVALNEYVSEFSQNRSWNLIGNPYPAYYDISAMETTAPITIWNGYNWVYEAYAPGDDNYILNPGQAFFIQRPIDQESITFKKEGRQNDLTIREDMIENVSRRAAANSERFVFNLILSGSEENLADRTRIVFDATAKMDYEAGRDASKFMSPEVSAAQLFTTVGGLRYAINNRPLSDGIVELGLSIGTTGSYTIALSTKVEGEVYLIDRETGSEIRLDGTEGYSFLATKGIIEGRFAVRFGNGDVTGIKGVANDAKDAGNWYNLNGQRINAPAKGIFIQDGKKAVVK